MDAIICAPLCKIKIFWKAHTPIALSFSQKEHRCNSFFTYISTADRANHRRTATSLPLMVFCMFWNEVMRCPIRIQCETNFAIHIDSYSYYGVLRWARACLCIFYRNKCCLNELRELVVRNVEKVWLDQLPFHRIEWLCILNFFESKPWFLQSIQ